MKKILLPIDGSERSMKSIDLIKELYAPGSVKISLITVREDLDTIISEQLLEEAKEATMPDLVKAGNLLQGYEIKKKVVFGNPGEEILNYAEEMKIDIIVMTKSTRTGWLSKIGSVTTHVVKYAKCIVVIVPEH
ncbi:MAG: universal stress protein [Acetobacterium sp.]